MIALMLTYVNTTLEELNQLSYTKTNCNYNTKEH